MYHSEESCSSFVDEDTIAAFKIHLWTLPGKHLWFESNGSNDGIIENSYTRWKDEILSDTYPHLLFAENIISIVMPSRLHFKDKILRMLLINLLEILVSVYMIMYDLAYGSILEVFLVLSLII